MAHEQRGSAAPRFVRLSFPTCRLVTTFYCDDQTKFATCAKCGVIAEVFYEVKGSHLLCQDCAPATSSYTCGTDKTTTAVALPIPVRPARNGDLVNAAVHCPGCSTVGMFGNMKAHIQLMHPDLLKQANQHKRAGNQVYGGTDTRNRRLPASPMNPSCSAEDQRKAAKISGRSYRTNFDIQQPAPIPPPGRHGDQAGGAVWGAHPELYQGQEILRDSSSQPTCNHDQLAAQSDPADVEMEEAEGYVPLPVETAIAHTEQRMTDVSNTSACEHCFRTFHMDKLEEHQNMCLKLVVKCWKLFPSEILKYYQPHVSDGLQGSKQTGKRLEDHIKDGLMDSPEFKSLLRDLMVECYEEHLSKHCQGIHDGLASIEEHIRTCQTFVLKCTQFWSHVGRDCYGTEENTGRQTNQQGSQSFQADAKNSVQSPKAVGHQSPTGRPDEDAPLQTRSISKPVECPFCLIFWDFAKIEEHVKNCQLWFEECRKLFTRQIQTHYKAYLSDGIQRTTPTGQILQDNVEDGLLSESVCQKWFSKVMATLSQEHQTKPWQGIPKDLTGFKERLYKDVSFISKCQEFLNQVVLEYQNEHSKDQCLGNKFDPGSMQQEDSRKSAELSSGVAGRDSPWQRHGVKGISASSNAVTASESKVKEAERVETSPQSPGGSGGDDLQRGKNELSLPVKCRFCSETWEPEEIDDHLTSCDKRFTKCPECDIMVHKDDYQQHCHYNCIGKQLVGTHVERTGEDNGGGTTTKDDIEELKNKVEKLEERLQKLELPLKRLIERLKKEPQDK